MMANTMMGRNFIIAPIGLACMEGRLIGDLMAGVGI